MKKRFKRELSIFRGLGRDTCFLMLSNFSEVIAVKLIFIFVNAYLFTRTNDIKSVAVFNLGFFITVIVGFYLNAALLKRFSVRTLFAPSLVLQGASMLVLFFITDLILPIIFALGLLYGLFLGFYWANRNFVFPALTNDDNRNYIAGLDSLVSNISGVVLPFMAGWFIVWSETGAGFGSELAYKLIVLFGVVVLFIGSVLLLFIEFPKPKITKFFIFGKQSKNWNFMRLFAFLIGAQFVTKLTFPEALSLSYLGNEGILGTVMAALSLLIGVTMYFVGRKMKTASRWKLLFAGNIPLVTMAFLLLFSRSPAVVILYLIAMSLANTTLWFVYFTAMARGLEIQGEGKIEDNYAYVLDHELVVNFGRIFFMMMFFFVQSNMDQETGLLTYIFGAAVVQMIALYVGKKVMGLQNGSI